MSLERRFTDETAAALGRMGHERELVARVGVEGRLRLRRGEGHDDRHAGRRRRCATARRRARLVTATQQTGR